MKDLYEILEPGSADWLAAEALDPKRLPVHVAIIMDGNGRWAKKRSLPRVAGHRAGVEPVRSAVETCARLGVQALTLYAFSVENWKRPRAEVETLWRLLRYYLKHELAELMRNNVRFQAIGRIDELPGIIQRDLQDTTIATSGNTGLQLSLAINYGGRAEIVDAVRVLVDRARRGEPVEVTEEAISRHLYSPHLPDPDLLIRTSGEMRVSNFLLWQIAYAELFVTDTLWPDFNRTELLRSILEFQRRERRFGGLGGTDSSTDESVSREAVAATR